MSLYFRNFGGYFKIKQDPPASSPCIHTNGTLPFVSENPTYSTGGPFSAAPTANESHERAYVSPFRFASGGILRQLPLRPCISSECAPSRGVCPALVLALHAPLTWSQVLPLLREFRRFFQNCLYSQRTPVLSRRATAVPAGGWRVDPPIVSRITLFHPALVFIFVSTER